MVMWIFFGATMFVGFFIVKGGQTFVAKSILGTGLPPYGILHADDGDPVRPRHVPRLGRHPAADSADFPADHEEPALGGAVRACRGVRAEDVPLWYGVIFMVNMQMAFLSPPFGYSLFYLKSVAPPEITMATIFRAAVNFMVLQWIGVGLCIIFPQIILWLPNMVYAH